jgi:class 3 adenylate cyclase/tetratricopeptide (TPR) repeat protein
VLICPSCGQENPAVARFCLACATPLREEAEAREERKVLTVLFADLVGFTGRAERLDPEDVRALLSPYYARLRSELERHGGTVEKFIGDAVVALFGAPVAHEDDPERAVRAALAIRDAIGELNEGDPRLELQVRIAVTTGEALVALAARPSEGEGMASGDVVNTAARLQAAAPVDGILVGETTYRATERSIVYREREPVLVKGKTRPLPVWEAVEARARLGVDVARQARTALVGRTKELDLLRGALARAREHRSPQLLTLVGVPGIGKSRLVFELLNAVEADPDLIFWRQGRSLPYGEGVTFWALAEIVKAQAGILETDAGDVAEEKLRRAVRDVADPAELEWLVAHLEPLVGLGEESSSRGERRAEAFAAWRRFLEGLAEQSPLVLVFEDLHWADDGLLDFVDHLVEWASGVPLLAVCTARPELLTRRPGWGGGKPNATTVSLSSLSEEETARLVAALLEQAVLPADAQTALLARAGGNPLYAEEYVRMLQDRGFLRRGPGGWRLERADELPLPESVQGIIAARLDALPAEEKALLQDAAVVGKVFWLGVLAALAGAVRSLEEPLHALERKELVRRERRSSVAGETQYTFLHLLMRDAAYGQIPRAGRADKHRRAAEWIESLSADRSEDRAEMLAYHYTSALELARAASLETGTLAERARVALREAGDRAFALGAFAAAGRLYAGALELWPRDGAERARLLFRYGRAVDIVEGTGEAVLAEARDDLLAAEDRETAAEAEVRLAEIVWNQGERDAAFEHVRRSQELVEGAGLSPSKAYVLSNVSRFLVLAGETERAMRIGREALSMAEELGLEELRAATLNRLGVARADSGDWEGLDDLEESIAIANGINSLEACYGLLNLMSVVACIGDLRRAFDLEVQAEELAERFGHGPFLRWLRAERLQYEYFTGGWDEALRLAQEFVAEAEADSPHYMEGICREYRGRIRLARGDVAGAVEDSDRELELARVAKDPQVLYPALSFRALALLAAGRAAEGAAHAEDLLSGWRDKRLVSGLGWPFDLAVVFDELGRSDELVAALAGGPETSWIAAARAFVLREFERAADILAEIGSRPAEAYARMRAGEALLAEGRRTEGSAELDRALAFYRSVGAAAYVRRGDAVLAASA